MAIKRNTSCGIFQVLNIDFKALKKELAQYLPVVGLCKTTGRSVRTIETALKVNCGLANQIIGTDDIMIHYLLIKPPVYSERGKA